jgi:negative regulator of sigma E activity
MLFGQVTLGACVSLTVIVKEQEPVKPTPSVALQTTVVVPVWNTAPLKPPLK